MNLRHIAAVARHNLGLVLGLVGRFEEAVRFEAAAEREFVAQVRSAPDHRGARLPRPGALLAGDVEAAHRKVKEA